MVMTSVDDITGRSHVTQNCKVWDQTGMKEFRACNLLRRVDHKAVFDSVCAGCLANRKVHNSAGQ